VGQLQAPLSDSDLDRALAYRAPMNPRRLLARIARGDVANVSFSDMQRLAAAFGSS
jgi:hypothetical protein